MPSNKRIVNYRKPFNLNIGIVIFGITFLYIIISVIMYFARDRVSYYEVVEGQSAQSTNYSYTGIAIRDENVFYSDNAGYIDYYAREASRVSKNTTLYSIDETGTVTKMLTEAAANDETSLSKKDIATIKEQISNFTTSFDDMNYESVYDFKSSLEGTVLQLINTNTLENITSSISDSKTAFQIKKTAMAGIVTYYIDDFQDFDESSLKEENFDKNEYVKANFNSGDLIESGSPIYTIINDEEWNIYIQLSKDDIEKYKDTSSVVIKFLKDGIEANANFEIIQGSDGKYGKLTLYKYMVRYATDRFVDIQIVDDAITGLKIPKTSVVEKNFYVIPVEYATKGADSDDIGFNEQIYTDDGEITIKFVTPTIFYSDEDYYYVNPSEFEGNEIFIKDNSEDKYQLETTISLTGVYNINSGYTIFVQINVLAETNEYYIVESETDYGLEVYDHIILDGTTVEENQVVFQ